MLPLYTHYTTWMSNVCSTNLSLIPGLISKYGMYVGPCDFHNVLKSTPAYLFLNVCVSVCECERVFTSTVYVFVLCSVSGKSCCFCFWSLQLFPSTNTRRFVKGHFRHPVRTYVLWTRAHVVRFILKLFRMLLRYMFCAGICVYVYICTTASVCLSFMALGGEWIKSLCRVFPPRKCSFQENYRVCVYPYAAEGVNAKQYRWWLPGVNPLRGDYPGTSQVWM